jgi:ketosteroid isomerase-like protein
VLTRTPEGLRLKHDHRHADGTEDAVTQYGGDTKDPGSNGRQEFHADAHTASLIPAASTNIWTVEIVPGTRFVYALRRVGTDRRFRVEFDLTRPVAAQAPSAADTIRRLDSLWARMYQTHDTTFAKQLYAEDLVWTMVNGNIKDKRAEMTDVAPAAGLVMEYFRTSGVDVRIPTGSNAAIVTGLAEWRFTMNGQARQVARRYTHVYARGGPLGWRIEAVHMGQAPSR